MRIRVARKVVRADRKHRRSTQRVALDREARRAVRDLKRFWRAQHALYAAMGRLAEIEGRH